MQCTGAFLVARQVLLVALLRDLFLAQLCSWRRTGRTALRQCIRMIVADHVVDAAIRSIEVNRTRKLHFAVLLLRLMLIHYVLVLVLLAGQIKGGNRFRLESCWKQKPPRATRRRFFFFSCQCERLPEVGRC